MNRDDIIRMAREAGLGATLTHHGEIGQWIEGANWTEELERFAALVAAAERKACLKLVEPTKKHRRNPHDWLGEEEGVQLLDAIAADIRKRGNP